MITTNRKQEIEKSITQLIAAYQLAMQEGDRSDILTKSIVTSSIIDSGRALATRLRTREQGTDDLVQKLELYYQALHAEDWVEKSKSAITKIAAFTGLTAGVMIPLILKFLLALLEDSFNFFIKILSSGSLLYVFVQILRWAYKEISNASSKPSMANNILSRTVAPAESQVYALIGGNRPVRRVELINYGVATGVGVIVFVIACGLALAVLAMF